MSPASRGPTAVHTAGVLNSNDGTSNTMSYVGAVTTAAPPVAPAGRLMPVLTSVPVTDPVSPDTRPTTSETAKVTTTVTVSGVPLAVLPLVRSPRDTLTLWPSPATTAPATTPGNPPTTLVLTSPLLALTDPTPVTATGEVGLPNPLTSTTTDAPLVVPSGTDTITSTSTTLPANTCRGLTLPLLAAVTASRLPSDTLSEGVLNVTVAVLAAVSYCTGAWPDTAGSPAEKYRAVNDGVMMLAASASTKATAVITTVVDVPGAIDATDAIRAWLLAPPGPRLTLARPSVASPAIFAVNVVTPPTVTD